MRRVVLLFAVLALVATGCSWTVPYDPQLSMSVDEATKVVERAVREQPPGYEFVGVRVEPERLVLVHDQWRGSLSRRLHGFAPVETSVYFDSLGKWDLSERKGWYVVRIWYLGDAASIRVFHPDLARAKHFMDALRVLSEQVRDVEGEHAPVPRPE